MRKWFDRMWGRLPADPVDAVDTSRDGFVIHLGGGSHTLRWESMDSIAVQFVTGSPEPRDTHYLFSLPGSDLRVSLETPGMNDFVTRLQKVPGFHNRAFGDALKCCADTPVVIWTNPKNSPTTPLTRTQYGRADAALLRRSR